MKKIFFIIILLVLLLPDQAIAHGLGGLPFFKVNGQDALPYPIFFSTAREFDLPLDLGPENYLVGQQLEFVIDENNSPIPPEELKNYRFYWDFGDGNSGATGLKNTHAYNKQGSYILKIYAYEAGKCKDARLMESILLNILADKNYKLPKAAATVDGQTPKDPLLDTLKADFSKELKFDAAKSDGGGAKIAEYLWDFGDTKTSNKQEVGHKYGTGHLAFYIVLRVKNADGFINDGFVQIQNTKFQPGPNTEVYQPKNPYEEKIDACKSASSNNKSQLPWVILGIAILAALSYFIAKKKRG